MTPMYELCDGSLGCDCISRRPRPKKKTLAHGTPGMYKKCKCIVCRRGNAKRMREWREKQEQN